MVRAPVNPPLQTDFMHLSMWHLPGLGRICTRPTPLQEECGLWPDAGEAYRSRASAAPQKSQGRWALSQVKRPRGSLGRSGGRCQAARMKGAAASNAAREAPPCGLLPGVPVSLATASDCPPRSLRPLRRGPKLCLVAERRGQSICSRVALACCSPRVSQPRVGMQACWHAASCYMRRDICSPGQGTAPPAVIWQSSRIDDAWGSSSKRSAGQAGDVLRVEFSRKTEGDRDRRRSAAHKARGAWVDPSARPSEPASSPPDQAACVEAARAESPPRDICDRAVEPTDCSSGITAFIVKGFRLHMHSIGGAAHKARTRIAREGARGSRTDPWCLSRHRRPGLARAPAGRSPGPRCARSPSPPRSSERATGGGTALWARGTAGGTAGTALPPPHPHHCWVQACSRGRCRSLPALATPAMPAPAARLEEQAAARATSLSMSREIAATSCPRASAWGGNASAGLWRQPQEMVWDGEAYVRILTTSTCAIYHIKTEPKHPATFEMQGRDKWSRESPLRVTWALATVRWSSISVITKKNRGPWPSRENRIGRKNFSARKRQTQWPECDPGVHGAHRQGWRREVSGPHGGNGTAHCRALTLSILAESSSHRWPPESKRHPLSGDPCVFRGCLQSLAKSHALETLAVAMS